jgi:hypothetical protein
MFFSIVAITVIAMTSKSVLVEVVALGCLLGGLLAIAKSRR